MSAPERLNVLLSRARNGLIMIGNADTFTNARRGSELWTKFFGLLKRDRHIYEGFPIKCERHPDRMSLLREAIDFDMKTPDGGCLEDWQVHTAHVCGLDTYDFSFTAVLCSNVASIAVRLSAISWLTIPRWHVKQ